MLRDMLAHRWLTNVLYPPACLLCHARLPAADAAVASLLWQSVMCQGCRDAMTPSGRPVCTRCGVGLRGAFDATVECRTCRQTPPPFTMARAPWRYTGAAQEAVRQFKYHRRWRLGARFAQDMATVARASLPLEEISVVLPVPLHWLKQRVKGFNPAEQLARPLAHSLEKAYAPRALRRTRWTRTQTRLGIRDRFRNVRAAFTADPHAVGNRSVLLVDDVLTSGATITDCTRALMDADARAVFVLTAARTPLG